MMRVIICGSRHFDNYPLMERILDKVFSQTNEKIEIVSGCQVTTDTHNGRSYGADYFGEIYAELREYPVKHFPAEWEKYGGKKAAAIRNKEMAEYGTHCVAFWDGRIEGSGTWMMINFAKAHGLKVRVIEYLKYENQK